MYGLKRNTERLFSNNGKLFVMAMDLPQTGMVKGLEKPRELLRSVENSRADGFIVNVGIANEMASGVFSTRSSSFAPPATAVCRLQSSAT